MGFHYFVRMLKKLRSIFVIDEEEPTAKPSSDAVPDTSKVSSDTGMGSDKSEMVRVKGGEVNERFLNVLLEAMEKHDLDGFDYMEFKRFLKSLDKVSMDEATKYRSAFATGQTMGATKDLLINSAKQYLDILEREQGRFEQAAQNQRSKVIDDKEAAISQLEKSIAAKEEQIKTLTKDIASDKGEIETMKEEISAASAKIQQTQYDFQHAYGHVKGQLEEDIAKIKQYLK